MNHNESIDFLIKARLNQIERNKLILERTDLLESYFKTKLERLEKQVLGLQVILFSVVVFIAVISIFK